MELYLTDMCGLSIANTAKAGVITQSRRLTQISNGRSYKACLLVVRPELGCLVLVVWTGRRVECPAEVH